MGAMRQKIGHRERLKVREGHGDARKKEKPMELVRWRQRNREGEKGLCK